MRKSTITGALAAAGIALAGCSPSEAPSPMPPAPGTPPPPSAIAPAEGSQDGDETRNVNTDLQFAQEMLALHEVELQLLEAGEANVSRQWVADLAQQFEHEHGPRIEEIRNWLREHGQSDAPPQNVGPGEDAQAPNVGAGELLSKLEEAQQGRVARLWIQGMLTHTQKVVDAATTEINEGTDPQLRSIAEQIKNDRQADIRELRQRLETL
ncbi:uncharacterized protein (DUF305 family) [Halopolyspora algeriensis]|uniref:Uncharacterized protein (DUF305 family) n=1 Tax=Halopolyspora algeriensis TaxID=1500506 RepID=A0A368VTV6_9ACTN|nr:DUF305 domain-containing protein [Halopolyspora algeriensis]RCW42883.1 uncharacterized protein (DUF305 family) [Halopolyspora algeriensis]TQM56648.1 uncharacterized protein (DUF305 family) [Halopolyspora algeriensis]